MREVIMGYQGEMSLKGLNRNQFESTMMKILRYRLKTVGKFRVYCTQSTFYMEPEEEDIDMDLAFERVSKVFGLAALSRAVVCEKDFDTICQTAEDYLGDSLHGIKTFKVEARRSDKTFPMTSPELMRELGAYLLGRHNYLRVDVKNPQFKVIVEIRDYGAYIHGPKIQGEGGLPVGTSGRALNMLSGGIDSSLAAYCMGQHHDEGVKTFSVGYDITGSEEQRDKAENAGFKIKLDELKDAREFAEWAGLSNKDVQVTAKEFLDIVPTEQYHMDEPLGAPSAIPLYFVSQLASKEVKVVQSGEGADELFGGYWIYHDQYEFSKYFKGAPVRCARPAARLLRSCRRSTDVTSPCAVRAARRKAISARA